MTDLKQYADRDITQPDLLRHYTKHISAMTGEGLHSKADIAAELAWRDLQIAQLKARPTDTRAAVVEECAQVVAKHIADCERWKAEALDRINFDSADRAIGALEKCEEVLTEIRALADTPQSEKDKDNATSK